MDDTISRQAAIDALDTGLWGVEWDKALATAMLKDLPSAQPERKRGKWKLNKDGNWACPFCEFDPYHDNMKGMNFCPNCGADMREETEDAIH